MMRFINEDLRKLQCLQEVDRVTDCNKTIGSKIDSLVVSRPDFAELWKLFRKLLEKNS